MLVNRMGDLGLSVALASAYALLGSLDYATVCLCAPALTEVEVALGG